MTSQAEVALIQRLRVQLSKAPHTWLAYSGGLDSSVLLHLIYRALTHHKVSHHDARGLKTLPPQLSDKPLTVLHINHQISCHASEWEAHCQRTARGYGFHCVVKHVELKNRGGGLEKAARSARYEAFDQCLEPSHLLLMAHHRNDQAETILFRLMRGTGIKGLQGIAACRPMKTGMLYRPLLNYDREWLQRYAEKYQLNWVDDESNQNRDFDRNFLRHEILPKLLQRWPSALKKINELADQMQTAEVLLEEYASLDLQACEYRKEKLGSSITLPLFKNLSANRQFYMIRYWVSVQQYPMPEQRHLAQLADLLGAKESSNPVLSWRGAQLCRFGGRIYLVPPVKTSQVRAAATNWDTDRTVRLGDFRVSSRLSTQGFPPGHYFIGFRQGAERSHPHFRRHSQRLKKLFQEVQIEPWLRDVVPLVYSTDHQLVAVGDYWVEKEFFCHTENSVNLVWSYLSEES